MKAFNKVSDFTNLYSLSKTLRFEAKPIGKTLENLKKSGILEQDLKRAEKYLQLKKIIDEYHKDFIEQALSDRKLDGYYLKSYKDLYFKRNKDDKEKEDFKAVSENLRKNIFIFFRDDSDGKESKEKLKKMLKADLIKELLPEFIKQNSKRLLSLFDKDPDSGIKSEDDLNETLKCFEKFTVYFTGFNENRENLYSSEEESTAIAYRSIDENLPIFLNNNEAFEKIVNVLTKDIETLSSDFNIDDISKFFSVNCYSNFLTQKNIDLYNAAIGGKTLENGNKIQGLNEYINLYNQQQKEKSKKLPFLKPLKKQILSDRKSASFLPKQFKDDRELLNAIEDFYAEYGKKQKEIKDLLQKLSNFDLSKIYLKNDAELKNILSKTYGSYQILDIAIGEKFEKDKPIGKKKLETYEKEKERFIKSFESFSIQEINGYLSGSDNAIAVENYFKQCGKTESGGDFFEEIEKTRGDIKILLENREIKSLIQDKDSIEKIKSFLDNLKKLQWLIKPLLGAENESDRDIEFYNRVTPIDNFFNENLTPLYNRVRNYLTRNPYSDVKVKLNFENPTLLDGWDKNKETDNTSVLLRKDGLYYLAIMSRGHNKIFESDSVYIAGDISIPSYEKIDYKLLPGPNKMLPKVFFSKKGDKKYSPSAELLNKYEYGLYKKGDKFDIKFMRELIDFFKDSIKKNEEWDCFDFHFSDTGSYEDISGFYREVEAQGYKISFRKIPQDYIDKAVEEGKIYLFQIYNKDFSQYSKGHPNLHTIYWRALFDEENIKNPIFKLNGEAEIFYREKTKDLKEVIHKAGEPISNKNKDGSKEKSKFPFDIRKDKRYSEDKILFHTPITLNFKGEGISNLNESVNAYIKNEKIKHIIGIDRGERHLLYLSLIDLKGNIVEQFSLNKIVNEYEGKEYSVDYCDLLVKKEGERNEARKNWQAISNIKEIKEGYLSQAVHKISKMIVEKEAIVIMEDLNMSFMRERQKVERQVYQKFEKMLIDKLNFLVDKSKTPSESGGLLNAYQLTNKFESFKTMGKQNGFLFYVMPHYTSKMDPATGFVNMFYSKYENTAKSKEFFNKFADIRFNFEKNYFEFVVDDYSKFNPKTAQSRLDWTVCSFGERIESFRNPQKNNRYDYKTVVLTEEFSTLFNKNGIDFKSNLKEQILEQNSADFFKRLMFLFKLTVQLRNSNPNDNEDYIISPVADESGVFFDSRKGKNMPENADANGAYNIAMKGLMIINKVKNAESLKKLDLSVRNQEYFQFMQEKSYK